MCTSDVHLSTYILAAGFDDLGQLPVLYIFIDGKKRSRESKEEIQVYRVSRKATKLFLKVIKATSIKIVEAECARTTPLESLTANRFRRADERIVIVCLSVS